MQDLIARNGCDPFAGGENRFTNENGAEYLQTAFADVQLTEFTDSRLVVTDPECVVDEIRRNRYLIEPGLRPGVAWDSLVVGVRNDVVEIVAREGAFVMSEGHGLFTCRGPRDGVPRLPARPVLGIAQPNTARMQGRRPNVPHRNEALHDPKFDALRRESVQKRFTRPRFHWSHRLSRDPHPLPFEGLERERRQFVAKEAGGPNALQPVPLDVSDHSALSVTPPRQSIILGRVLCEPEQDPWAVPREEIRRLVSLVHSPHQRIVEPFLPRRSSGWDANRPWDERFDRRVVAEVEKASADSVYGHAHHHGHAPPQKQPTSSSGPSTKWASPRRPDGWL